jgi:methionine synthase I (cobalamin-dependent)/5,10-methylenetetrahydrofolate reductase
MVTLREVEGRVGLRAFIKASGVAVADGAMATALYNKGFYINRSFEELSVLEPQAVREIHQGFVKAGAQIIHTNTFNAVEPKLVQYGLQAQLKEILKASVSIAKSAADQRAYVLGAIGPLGLMLEPLGPTSREEAIGYFKKNLEVLNECAVDGISLVGFHDLVELECALIAAQQTTTLPLFATIGVQESLKTSYGNSLQEFVLLCAKFEVDVLGLAGEVGPSGMLSAIEKLRPLTERPIMVLPNAGLPRYVNDQYIYLCNPDYLGKFTKRFVAAGVSIVGGHCGVYDDHIRAITNSVKMSQSHLAPKFQVQTSEVPTVKPVEPKALAQKSMLGKDLAEGKRVVSIELLPPKGVEVSDFLKKCEQIKAAGVKYVNIPDGARAVARMGSLHLASFVKHKIGLEPIPHFTARDRNLIGLQSDLLGAHVNGIRNVLLVTGDPPKLGNNPGASAVYDVDAIGLTHIVSRMNRGMDLGGTSFGVPSDFVVGVALNPTASNVDLEIQRFKYKVEAGAEYAITQPVYSIEAYKKFFAALGEVKIPIIVGIWPLVSLRNAEFLKNEVPGIDVPDFVVERMRAAKENAEVALQTGLEISLEIMDGLKNEVAGFQVSAPFNRAEVAVKVLSQCQ